MTAIEWLLAFGVLVALAWLIGAAADTEVGYRVTDRVGTAVDAARRTWACIWIARRLSAAVDRFRRREPEPEAAPPPPLEPPPLLPPLRPTAFRMHIDMDAGTAEETAVLGTARHRRTAGRTT
ncbi:hypothetical protein [Streptomyces sp. NPDC050535]|uniref:hypothetical protein n=1 Tax=Streptomyces sp. NPDC050535 TaxID=3365626 RepID=UPI0037B55D90